ncbi:MAG: hypothetical protein KC910_01485 [Candidatus Eremiobacteraeota bacterium]|nr:hypothetical protein [Candidatus Eremiobacteraeota bacterium]
MKATSSRGLTLAEVVLAIGLMAMALFALLSVCSMAVRYQKQSINNINAARVADAALGRAMSSALNDTPAGAAADFWDNEWPYPTSPWVTGTEAVGHQRYFFAIYATTVPSLGDVDNAVKRVDAYVWWTENQAGAKLTAAMRLVNKGEEP